MDIKSKLRKVFFSSAKGEYLFYKLRILREKRALKKLTDLEYVQETYKNRFGKDIDLVDPKGYGEKLQWLKLFYRHPDMPRCTDKYEARGYIEEQGLGYLLNDLIGVYDDANDIDFDSLPDRFVVKATHGSGWNLIVKDKSTVDWKNQVKVMNSWLKLNLYVFGREWNYKDLKPRLVVEKFIDHEPLNDYKYMCFNGEPLYMQLNNDYEGAHYVDFYDLRTWTQIPVTYSAYKKSDRHIEKPPKFDEMMELARKLSKPFPFVRVDFYNYDDTILFGELTFFPGGGLWPFAPMDKGYNESIGAEMQLPEPNHNLEILEKLREEKKK